MIQEGTILDQKTPKSLQSTSQLVGTLKDKFSFSYSIMHMFSPLPSQCCVKKSSYRASNRGVMLFPLFSNTEGERGDHCPNKCVWDCGYGLDQGKNNVDFALYPPWSAYILPNLDQSSLPILLKLNRMYYLYIPLESFIPYLCTPSWPVSHTHFLESSENTKPG